MSRFLAPLVLGLMPAAALAQSGYPGFVFQGRTGVEFLDSGDGDPETYAYADFGIGLDGSAMGSMPFGFRLDVLGYYNFGGDVSDTWLRPWVYYDSPAGRFSLGQMPALSTSYLGPSRVAGSYFFDKLIYGRLLNSPVHSELLNTDTDLFGLRYDGSAGPVTYSVQAYAEDFDAVDAYSAALGYDLGPVNLAVVWESLPNAGVDDFIGASVGGSYGALGWKAKYLTGLALGSGSYAFILNADYAVTDAVTLGGAYISGNTGSDSIEVSHVFAAYEILPGLEAELGYARADDSTLTVGGIHYGFDF